jgi:hypothetical protein
MNIVESEVPLKVRAKTCGLCNEEIKENNSNSNKKKVTYSFIDGIIVFVLIKRIFYLLR